MNDSSTPLPLRASDLTCGALIDCYMARYTGRDSTRVPRLAWWKRRIGELQLVDICDDQIHQALVDLEAQPPRFFAGKDADGQAIYKAKRKPISAATVNRYQAAIAAVFTWAIRQRIAVKGWLHPCRGVQRRTEAAGGTRFLSDAERERLLEACRRARWSRLYGLALMALTTGARRGELMALRWSALDLERGLAHVARSKNGDSKTLPLPPAVVDELRGFGRGASDELVFKSRLRASQPFDFKSVWKKTLADAKIRAFRFHDLRHSCASMMAQGGCTLLEIADVLGHRELKTSRRYSHLTVGHKTALVQRVMGEIR